jgi:hypothetical protein
MRRLARKLKNAVSPAKVARGSERLVNPHAGKVIEVYDVIIKSPKRLQCFKLSERRDMLTIPSESDYYDRMEVLFRVKPQ